MSKAKAVIMGNFPIKEISKAADESGEGKDIILILRFEDAADFREAMQSGQVTFELDL
jgi:hypothetical protein